MCVQTRWVYFALILLVAAPALAHRPYEHPVGSFQRADGKVVSIVEYFVDGIFFADPVSIQFRFQDGTTITNTKFAFDAVVRQTPRAVEVYQFRSTWIPIASRVDLFDGYTLKDITSTASRPSALIHFTNHWLRYLIALGFAFLFWRLWATLQAMPNRGWRMAVRFIGFPLVGLAMALYAYDMLLFEPLSPLALVVGVVVLVRVYRWSRQRLEHATAD